MSTFSSPKSKINAAQGIYLEEIQKVQESADKWKAFLDFTAQTKINDSQNNFEFATKLIIHAHNPKAKDCRTYDDWKNEAGNHVNRYEKGIPVLSRDKSGKQTVIHLFDSSQTVLNKESEIVTVPAESKEKLKASLENVIEKFSDNSLFSEEQQKIFTATADYKLCKQFGLDTEDSSDRFAGIDNLSVIDIANIGIALNKCSQEFSEIVNIERSISNERSNNSKPRDERTEFQGRERNRVDLGGGVSGTRNEIPIRRNAESVVQTQRGEPDIRAFDRDSRTEADSSNGQVRQHEAEIHMADPLPVGNTDIRQSDSTLRGDERESSGNDRQDSREEKEIGGIQGNRGIRGISSESSDTGEIQNGSRGRSSSGNSIRNMSDETAESEQGSVVSACYEKLKNAVLNDKSVINAHINSDNENLNLAIQKALKQKALDIFLEDIDNNAEFYNDFLRGKKAEKHLEIEKAIFDTLSSQRETVQKDVAAPDNKIFLDFGDGSSQSVSESTLLNSFVNDTMADKDISFALGNAIMEYLDEKQHSEREIKQLEAGWYKKTDFTIKCDINGEDFEYSGRFDIGDGKGTGGGSLIDHIETVLKSRVENNPFNESQEELEVVQKALDTLVPFLRENAVLTPDEQKILDTFKEENPIRKEKEFENKDLKSEEQISLMSDEKEVQEPVSEDTVNPIIIDFNGDSESLNEIKDKALSLGATCTLIASGLVVETYENHKNELLETAHELGLIANVRGENVAEPVEEVPQITLYHGTTADFDSFRPDYRGAIWTDTDFDRARNFAGNSADSKVLTCEAEIKNPAHYAFSTADNWDIDGVVNEARANGHDSAIIDFKFSEQDNGFYQFCLKNYPDNLAKEVLESITNARESDALEGETIAEFAKRMKEQNNVVHSYVAVFDPDLIQIKEKTSVAEISEEIETQNIDNEETHAESEPNKAEHITVTDETDTSVDKSLEVGDIVTVKDYPGETWRVTEISSIQISFENVDENANAKMFSHFDFGVDRENLKEKLGYTIVSPAEKSELSNEAKAVADEIENVVREKKEVADELNHYIKGEPPKEQTEQVEQLKLFDTVDRPYQADSNEIIEPKFTSNEEINSSADDTVSNTEKTEQEEKTYFKITDEHLGEGSKREKFRNNVEAIKTLKALEAEERLATNEEKETLAKYIGWGGLQEAFDKNNTSWYSEYIELKGLLSAEEYEAARSTVNDAFYTSPIITQAIYEGLDNIGFKGGEILEPSMGIGNFFGTMPDKMRESSNLSGVEIDSISGRIAQKLYPEANIAINGFEKIKPQKGSFDLAIGNVPFGNKSLNDKTKAYKGLMIHDYFFAKSLDSVRSGGVVAFVTSTGTMDKEDTKVRQMLAQKAELMGAVRLPSNAFSKNAGTTTSTDIIFLKKREKQLNISDMAQDKSCDWVYTKANADGFKVNSYFAENPQMVLGTLSDNGRFGSIVCNPIQGADLKEQLHEAMKNIKGEYNPPEFQQELDEKNNDGYLPATPDIENLTYTVVDDKLYYRVDDNLIPLKESEQHGITADRRKAMCGLGETVRELLKAQVEDRPDMEIKQLQIKLNQKYDSFARKYGRINPTETPNASNTSGVSRKSPNSNVFKNDVRLPLLQSLEKMQEGQFVGKTAIFTERTIRPHKVAEHVDTSHEALILSVSEKGKIDFDYMEQLTGFEKDKIIEDLKGDIYPVPELSSESNTVYQTSDEYLSGNIYKKIAVAEAKLSENPAYTDNIAALTAVIPTPLKATEIDMQLGMTWIDPKIIQQFMYETFETNVRFREYDDNVLQKNPNAITVHYSGAGKGSWKIENARKDNSIKVTKNLGTKDYNAYELLEKILNSKSVAVTQTIKDRETGKNKTVILEKETRAAEDKVKLINAAFKSWIFKDSERRNSLVQKYNEMFNGIRPREYDGSNLNFFGSNPEINLKPHQKNAVAHALFGGNTLFAHQVGAGKTFEMIATAMEGKRLGLHTKSMFVVPNHLTEQIGSDFMKLYPNANILVAKQDDFSPQKRRQMCARIATGNFDAVIIGHSQLIKIPLSPKREEEFIRSQIDEVVSALEAAKETDSKSYTVKQLEATKAKLRERLDKLINSAVKDNTVTFEELGIDKLFVDEAHEFKNLYVSTKMENVSGLSTNADVQKTEDLYMKCQYLDEKTGSKGVVFSTGTPVTNALSEMYTTMKYLQSDLLKETGLESFDAWAGNYTRKSTEAEISPSGTDWRMKTRLKFTNVPELVTMFKECADIKMSDQLNLDVPECKMQIVSVEPTELQKATVQSLAERAEKISQGAVSRAEDNMLVVTGDGRKLGLDQRLFDPSFPDEPGAKVNSCVNNVFDIWEKTADKRSTQLIFCDLGVPQSNEDIKKNGKRFDVYDDIRSKLIEKGIPEKEIAFIHEANSETEKAKLFAKVRSGAVRVLIGSTQKMGAGTNVQDKLIALHDLDCPWRPADLTQRLGRMVRQGNENDEVENFRYVTKGTFDAYLYQMVEKKQESISQIFTSKQIARTCDDIDSMSLELMQIKMSAVGDERVKRQMELMEDIRGLNMQKNTYLENKYELEDNIEKLPLRISETEKSIEGVAKDTETIRNYKAPIDENGKEAFEMKVGNTVYTDKKEAAEALKSAMSKAIIGNPKKQTEIAEYKNFKIAVSYDSFTKSYIGCAKGAEKYPIEFGSSEIGNITRIDNVIASVPGRIDNLCNALEFLKKQLSDSKAEVSRPFEHETELEEKKQELEQLTNEINADKINGNISPEQPESTVNTPDKTEKTSEDKSEDKPSALNIKWQQNGKEIKIVFDSNAEDKIKAFVDGKESGHCSPEQFVVTDVKGDYPDNITKCISPLNIAFSEATVSHINEFSKKIGITSKEKDTACKPLFSRNRIMSDEFKPTSSKENSTPPTQQI